MASTATATVAVASSSSSSSSSSSDFGDDDDGVHGQRMKPLSTIEAFFPTRNAAHHLPRKKNVQSSTASAHQEFSSMRQRPSYKHSCINKEDNIPRTGGRFMRESRSKSKIQKQLGNTSNECEGQMNKLTVGSMNRTHHHNNPLSSLKDKTRSLSHGHSDTKPPVYQKPKKCMKTRTNTRKKSVKKKQCFINDSHQKDFIEKKHHLTLPNQIDILPNAEKMRFQVDSTHVQLEQNVREIHPYDDLAKGQFFGEQLSSINLNCHRKDPVGPMELLPIYDDHDRSAKVETQSCNNSFDSLIEHNLASYYDSEDGSDIRDHGKDLDDVIIDVQKRPFRELSKKTDILLGELNPGIINRVRDRKQVRAALCAIIGSSCMIQSGIKSQPIQSQHGNLLLNSEPYDLRLAKRSKKDDGTSLSKENGNRITLHSSVVSGVTSQRNCETENDPLEKLCENRQANYGITNGARNNNLVHGSEADIALCWLELLRLDIKGRLSALKRSRRRLRYVLLSGNVDEKSNWYGAEQLKKPVNWDGIGKDWNEMHKWRAFFLHMDSVLFAEAVGLENWLGQVTEMQSQSQKIKGF